MVELNEEGWSSEEEELQYNGTMGVGAVRSATMY